MQLNMTEISTSFSLTKRSMVNPAWYSSMAMMTGQTMLSTK